VLKIETDDERVEDQAFRNRSTQRSTAKAASIVDGCTLFRLSVPACHAARVGSA
jgi:hypothetical protein